MKILIVGADGQLGTELQRIIKDGRSEIGEINTSWITDVLPADIKQLDITDQAATFEFVQNYNPDIIYNCAAMTNVDGCERDPDAALKVNALAAQNVALAANMVGAELVHVSTDYVFSGEIKNTPYREWDKPNPQSAYGSSKLLGEELAVQAHSETYVVRTAWLYGYRGGNFVKTIINAAQKNDTLTIVDDQRGNPTSANDLAHHLLLLPGSKNYGVYHCTNEGICSWYEFAVEFLKLSGIEVEVKPITSDQYPTPTKRPEYSALDNMMLRNTIGNNMRDWKDAIASYIENLEDRG